MRSLLTLFFVVSSLSFGQNPANRPEFDVVDIKLNNSGSPDGVGEILPGGQFRAINIPVKEIVKFAYNLRDEAVAGAPGWLSSDRYDIVGKAPAAGSEETFWRSDSRLQLMRLYYTDQTVVDQGGMTIPEALDKLLGLKWEERKQPMPVVVIDHIEKPSAN